MSLAGLLIEARYRIQLCESLDAHLFKTTRDEKRKDHDEAGDEARVATPLSKSIDGKANRSISNGICNAACSLSSHVNDSDMGKLLIELTAEKPHILSKNIRYN